jgi:hypothetical protein
MIIYNVTISVDNDIHEEWLSWMKEVHIPEVMNKGIFKEHRMMKVLTEEDTGQTYSIQYYCESMEDYERYRDQFARELQQKTKARYHDKFVAFRTLLQLI